MSLVKMTEFISESEHKKLFHRGYILIPAKGHPRAWATGHYSYEHIVIMEKHLGRYLNKGEVVHHINEDRTDNRIENLQLMTKSEHISHHCRGKMKDTSDYICNICKTNKTCMQQPTGNNKTPYPRWHHLPHDKVNWYCNACYKREKIRLKAQEYKPHSI